MPRTQRVTPVDVYERIRHFLTVTRRLPSRWDFDHGIHQLPSPKTIRQVCQQTWQQALRHAQESQTREAHEGEQP